MVAIDNWLPSTFPCFAGFRVQLLRLFLWPLLLTVCVPFLHLIHGLCAFFRLLLTPPSRQPLLCHPLNSRFALHGFRAFDFRVTFLFSRFRALPLTILTSKRKQGSPKEKGMARHCRALHRERKLNTNFFFSNFSGAPGISQQNPGISRPECLLSLVSRDISNFLAPTHSRGRPLPHWKISGPKSLGLDSFFFPAYNRSRVQPWKP